MRHRKYQKSHKWLTFELDLAKASYRLWLALGEARSKCAHIAGVPLKPNVAVELRQVYLSKGVQATTAIEGNTLSEEQVRARVDRQLELPLSREYLGREIDNVLAALQDIWDNSDGGTVSPKQLFDWNRTVLSGLEVEPPAVPGRPREHEVTVGRYLGAPPDDLDYLLAKLCDFVNEPWSKGQLDRVTAGILKAITAHLYLAWIHPFGDGNGRTARLLEFKILTAAGVPDVAAHVLTNHYNLTRSEYYRQLDAASKSGGDVFPFVEYAVQGFVDGLTEQINRIQGQQLELAWRDYVHEMLPDSGGKGLTRQRHLLLDMPIGKRFPTLSALANVSGRVATDYGQLTRTTLQRDVAKLLDEHLLIQEEQGFMVNISKILAFQPETTNFEV
ncbi:MAG: Fic family protein [Fimbriimonadales bacterium]